MQEREQFKREIIPDSETSRQEGPVLFRGFARAWYHIVTPGGRAE